MFLSNNVFTEYNIIMYTHTRALLHNMNIFLCTYVIHIVYIAIFLGRFPHLLLLFSRLI